MIEFILEIDKQFFLYLNSLHTNWLDIPMFWLSETMTSLPVYIYLLYILYKTYKKHIWVSLISIALLITLSDQTTSGFMKPYFQRLRPSHEPELEGKVHLVRESNGNLYKGGQYGFASSHAANTFAVAMFFFLVFRRKFKYISLIFVWSFLVSYTRIYLGVHYPLDITVGALVGILFAISISYIHQNLISKLLLKKSRVNT